MLIYLLIDFSVVTIGWLFVSHSIKIGKRKIDGVKLFFILSAILLIFISAFRGDFSTDYRGYEEIYHRFSRESFESIVKRPLFSNPETGYLVLQYIIQKVFGNVIFLFIITSIIIVVLNLHEIKKQCELPMLAVLLFIEVGIYSASFNLLRQSVACSILLLGTKFLYERKLFKYLGIVAIATLFHTSAIIMVLFYFVSTVRVSKKRIYFYPIIIGILCFSQLWIMNLVNQYFWTWYDVSDTTVGYSWKNIVMPIFLSIIAFVLYFLDKKRGNSFNNVTKVSEEELETIKHKETIWLNATVLFIVFYLMGLTYSYAQRCAYFFSTYMICFFCLEVYKSKYMPVIELGTIVFIIIYGFITKLDIPYYFIWN